MNLKIVLIPAKEKSSRIPLKNWREFYGGASLVKLKVRAALRSSADLIVISTDCPDFATDLEDDRVIVRQRSAHLCCEHVDLESLFMETLNDFKDDAVFWAHATSPFVSSETIDRAFELCFQNTAACVLGVKERQSFLWSSSGPINYNPLKQPRSQDLAPFFEITGGVHCAMGSDFIRSGAVSFEPACFLRLKDPESIDIDDLDDWNFARMVAPLVFGNNL